jgi:hypothetical protein
MLGVFLTLILLLPALQATGETEEAWDFPDDDLEQRLAEVSEGDLTLLSSPPARPVHHHRNRIRIRESSLQDGWIGLEQCHEHLDPVGALEIVYHPGRIRNLRILSSSHIETSRVSDAKVELTGIGHGASLCLSAESRALILLDDGRYRLRNGPYMRRFLDGYYPMHVTLEIEYPPGLLEPAGFRPQPGAAGRMEQSPGLLHWESWFKGTLFTEFDFHAVTPH